MIMRKKVLPEKGRNKTGNFWVLSEISFVCNSRFNLMSTENYGNTIESRTKNCLDISIWVHGSIHGSQWLKTYGALKVQIFNVEFISKLNLKNIIQIDAHSSYSEWDRNRAAEAKLNYMLSCMRKLWEFQISTFRVWRCCYFVKFSAQLHKTFRVWRCCYFVKFSAQLHKINI